jgi:DNA-binding transcriptional LysR family regulator
MAEGWVGRSGELEMLLRVAQAGSLSAAARELGLSPSGVSRVIARLEARLGTRPLVRTTRRLALTPEGEAIARPAGASSPSSTRSNATSRMAANSAAGCA